MAIVHDTTMTPGKLELLAAWLSSQPWYLDRGHEPQLALAGQAGAGWARLSGTWRLPDGTRVRGVLTTARAVTP